MLELRPAELAAETVPELEAAIQVREVELASIEQRLAESMAALAVTTDPARRAHIKKSTALLGEDRSDVLAIRARLRLARRQVIDDALLRARGGVPMQPIWPEMPGERPSSRVRSRGIE